MPARRGRWPGVSLASVASPDHGGGHSLRIGRPEHPRFDRPGWRASHLLDLFHCGRSRSDDPAEREGPLEAVSGRINLNTASREVLRCALHGALGQDPSIARVVDPRHETRHGLRPRLQPLPQSPDEAFRIADALAAAMVRHRPYASPSELMRVVDERSEPLFGNPRLFDPSSRPVQWSDAAAEEWFARVHDVLTVRSRNFRVWLVGECLRGDTGANANRDEAPPEVVARAGRVLTLFVDPGPRAPDGQLLARTPSLRILHAQDF